VSKIILADNVYIPKDQVDMDKIRAGYERHVYNEKVCKKCDNLDDRFNDICSTCPAHQGFYVTWKKETINNKRYIGLPKGDLGRIERYTGIDLYDPKLKVDDRRAKVKARHPLTFTKKLYTGKEIINGVKTCNQIRAVKTFWEYKYGIIKSVPRSGKTVMAARLICAFKRRTLFIANERELLKQGLRTMRAFTNVRELEAKHKTKLVGIIQKESDWDENWDTVFCTYQKLISAKGRKILRKYIHKKFGSLCVDEVHRANAHAYAECLNFIDTEFAWALTATDKRKDQLQFLVRQIIGPVVVKTEAEGLVPNVHVHYTGFAPKNEWSGMTAYTNANTWLAGHKERNKILVRQIFRDLR